jgi:hypothetical protein
LKNDQIVLSVQATSSRATFTLAGRST